MNNNKGWHNESKRHYLARRGIKTGRKPKTTKITPDMMSHPKDTKIFYNPFGPEGVPGYIPDIKRLLMHYKPQTTVMAYNEKWWPKSDIIDSVFGVYMEEPDGYDTDKIIYDKNREREFLRMIESGQLEMPDDEFNEMLDQNHSKLLSDRFCEGEYYNPEDDEKTFEYDPMNRDCVYYTRALHDEINGGENYQVGPHNVLKYGDQYWDANGPHSKSELIEKYGAKPRPDPDGWNYILDEDRLKFYRKKIKNKPILPNDPDLIGGKDEDKDASRRGADMWR